MHKNAVRIIAICLAALMLIGVITGAVLNSFALESCAVVSPSMGQRSKVLPITVAAVAVIAAGSCIAIPKLKNKRLSGTENDAED